MTLHNNSVAAEESRWARRGRLFLRRGWPLVVAMAVAGAVVGGFLGTQKAYEYTAEARLFVTLDTAGSGTDINQGAEFVLWQMPSYAELAESQYVLQPVSERVGIEGGVDALRQRLEVVRPSDTAILELTVGGPSREQAAQVANAVADQLRLAIIEASDTGGENIVRLDVEVVDQASADTAVAGEGDTWRLAAVFALGGALLGFLLLMLAALLDRKVRGIEDMTTLTDVPVLEFRTRGEKAKTDSTLEALAVAQLIATDSEPAMLAVLAAGPGTDPLPLGQSLASELTQLGSDIVLLDITQTGEPVESRRGTSVPSTEELRMLVHRREPAEEDSPSRDTVQALVDAVPTVEGITVDGTQLAELGWDFRRSEHVSTVLQVLWERADIVVVALGPVQLSPWSASLTSRADAVVLQARRDNTVLGDIVETTTSLRIGGANIVAAMLQR